MTSGPHRSAARATPGARAVLGGLAVVALAAGAARAMPACLDPPPPARLAQAVVTQVVDGDTIRVRRDPGASERVRLIGIDAPEVYDGGRPDGAGWRARRNRAEIRAQGRLALAFARRHLAGRRVRLEFDVERLDRFGRTLAYVWMDDGAMFNLFALREGYARVLTIPPNVRYAALFVACQREARAARRGLWGP